MHHALPELPYPVDALEPWLSAEAVRAHRDHHRRCIDGVNRLVAGSAPAERPLEELVVDAGSGALFDHAAESWNHAFFWRSLRPRGGAAAPDGPLGDAIRSSFGSMERLHRRFAEAALAVFGAGWAWLVRTGPTIVEVQTTRDAVNPLVHGRVALLGCDLWEHAYYLDYRGDRAAYLEGFWSHADWAFAAARFAGTADPVA